MMTTDDLMPTIRALDNPALRLLIARALGWRIDPRDKWFQWIDPDGAGHLVYRTVAEAIAQYDGFPDWPGSHAAAWSLLKDLDHVINQHSDLTSVTIEFGVIASAYGVVLAARNVSIEETHANPARAICYAWIAYQLRQGGDVAARLRVAVGEVSENE